MARQMHDEKNIRIVFYEDDPTASVAVTEASTSGTKLRSAK